MTNASATVSPEQLAIARDLLPLFANHGVRGSAATREAARLDLIAALASTDADQGDHLHDAIHEGRYYLGLICLECHGLIPDDVGSTDYCSRTCYQEGGL